MLRSRLILVFAVVLYVAFFFVGCSTISDAIDAYKVCKANVTCSAEMESGRSLAESLAIVVASGVPVPAVNGASLAVGSSVGMLVSLLIGVFRGRKYKGR